ncbi:hypothetical protein SSX86_005750 [Deinandra increscens subsp. villosa]|uniref:Uncharacterized protein n=1 Tax=Deinandra increscens subsp. villosa TaxID=3103831 RepID=A0AAP0H758_9ASTR
MKSLRLIPSTTTDLRFLQHNSSHRRFSVLFYDVEGSTRCLKKCIAKVTNTPWGERVQFLFNPNSYVVAKQLHVSPFMDMPGNWNMKTSVPGDNLVVNISVNHHKLGVYFTGSLTANRISSSSVEHAVFFWLMPHNVAIWIYWH